MNKSSKGKWHGLAALIWMGAVAVFFLSMTNPIWFSSPAREFCHVFWAFVWWPAALVLVISGLWRGNIVNRICAILAICLAAGIVLIMSMAGV